MRYDHDTLALGQIPHCYTTVRTTTSQDAPNINEFLLDITHMKTITTHLTSLFHDKHITASVCESA